MKIFVNNGNRWEFMDLEKFNKGVAYKEALYPGGRILPGDNGQNILVGVPFKELPGWDIGFMLLTTVWKHYYNTIDAAEAARHHKRYGIVTLDNESAFNERGVIIGSGKAKEIAEEIVEILEFAKSAQDSK
jgi:hypothetical protein